MILESRHPIPPLTNKYMMSNAKGTVIILCWNRQYVTIKRPRLQDVKIVNYFNLLIVCLSHLQLLLCLTTLAKRISPITFWLSFMVKLVSCGTRLTTCKVSLLRQRFLNRRTVPLLLFNMYALATHARLSPSLQTSHVLWIPSYLLCSRNALIFYTVKTPVLN